MRFDDLEEGTHLAGFLSAYESEPPALRIEKRRVRGRKSARSRAQRAAPKSIRVHQINFRASIRTIGDQFMDR